MGESAIHIADSKGHREVVELLLTHKDIDVNAKTNVRYDSYTIDVYSFVMLLGGRIGYLYRY